MTPDLNALLETVRPLAVEAGKAALAFYGQDTPIELKADNSPLTLADRAAHDMITSQLAKITPDIPVVSEESDDVDALSRAAGQWLWLVDPLDGTKEFIKQSGQFTVNIGLVCGGTPVLGVVHAPTMDLTYLGINGPERTGAWIERPEQTRQPIATRKADLDHLTIVASRDHAGPVVTAFLERLTGAESTSMGSSLKVCLVAEGKADFYPRVVPTMQWDTAAAQAVVQAAGGHVTDLQGTPLEYRRDRLRNPSILVFGDASIDWPTFFGAE